MLNYSSINDYGIRIEIKELILTLLLVTEIRVQNNGLPEIKKKVISFSLCFTSFDLLCLICCIYLGSSDYLKLMFILKKVLNFLTVEGTC